MRFAFADPPYFGCGASHYGEHHPDAADWDERQTHLDLIARLCDEYPDGWALSLNPRDLAWQLAACPDDVRVAAWCKTWHQIRPTTVQFAWEPVLFRGGRKDNKRSPMIRDWMACAVTRQRGLKGAKPDQFNRWVLDLLNHQDGDTLDDLFPGTSGMARTLGAPPFELEVPRGMTPAEFVGGEANMFPCAHCGYEVRIPQRIVTDILAALADPAVALAKHDAEVLRAAADDWTGGNVPQWLRDRADRIEEIA